MKRLLLFLFVLATIAVIPAIQLIRATPIREAYSPRQQSC